MTPPPGPVSRPQVGARRRLFIYSCEDADGTLQRGVVLNPVLQRFGGIALDEETLEGCLSVPGEGFPTARHRGARVTGTDLRVEVIVEDEGGALSRALQHEVDHLDGSLFLDRLTPARRRGPGRGEEPRLAHPQDSGRASERDNNVTGRSVEIAHVLLAGSIMPNTSKTGDRTL